MTQKRDTDNLETDTSASTPSLDDQLDALLSESRNLPARRKQARRASDRAPEDAPKPHVPTSWQTYEEISLLIHTTHCKHCGSEHQSPNVSLFLKIRGGSLRNHNSDYTHYTSLDRAEADSTFSYLPRVTNYKHYTVPACPECWTDKEGII